MIFNLFKSKPSLKELIPKGFVDIHSHILPGIDDGAKNSEESLKLISEMKKLGFSKIIGTPHSYPGLYDNTSDSIKNAFKKLENLGIEDISHLIFHPGGKKIIQTVEGLFVTLGKNIDNTKSVLRHYGNMSSATVLYVLKAFMDESRPAIKS